MTQFEVDRPQLSWELLHSMMAHATWSEAWRQTGAWAFHVLEAQLGEDWPETVCAKNPTGGAPQLAWAAGHVAAYAQMLELALRLDLLKHVGGYAKVRRVLRSDPRPPQLTHCEIQLETAGLALRSGLSPELEPAPLGERPADIAMRIEGQPVVVEARAILTSDDRRDENARTEEVFERVHRIESKHGVRCEGEISVRLDGKDTEVLLDAIETRARLVANRLDPPPIGIPGVAIDVVDQARVPARGLKGPEMLGDSWARIGLRIHEKAVAAVESGANWLVLMSEMASGSSPNGPPDHWLRSSTHLRPQSPASSARLRALS